MNQEELFKVFNAVGGVSGASINEAIIAACVADSITSGQVNERLITFLQNRTGLSTTNLPGLLTAVARQSGAANWHSLEYPVALMPGCIFWLDGYEPDNSISHITRDGSLKISATADKTGSGITTTQGTGSAQPTYTPNGKNGKQTILFDGGDYLVASSGIYTMPNGNNTTFCVAKQDTSGVLDRMASATAAGSTRWSLDYTATGEAQFYNNATFTTVTTSGLTSTNWNLFTAYKSGTTQSISVNGGTAVTNSSGANTSGIDGFAVGASVSASTPLNGQIAELIIFNRALTATEITYVNTLLTIKWGL